MTSTALPSPAERIAALGEQYGLRPDASRKLIALARHLGADERAPTAISDPQDVVDRHIADSLIGLEVPQVARATAIADMGAGAGVPGLVLATSLPAAHVTEVESQTRKAAYIQALADDIGLTNASVVCARAERWPGGLGAHDLVTARALASQPVVLEYAAPLLVLGGFLVEWRGRRDSEEERAGDEAAAVLGLRRIEVRRVKPFAAATDRHLHTFEKVAETPSRFPRRPGVAARRPLGISR